jgi:iron(III) transport system substrate-binding protein
MDFRLNGAAANPIYQFILIMVMLIGASDGLAAADWNSTLQAGQREGNVVLGTNEGSPALRQNVSSKMKQRFGINVDVRFLDGAELNALMSRECDAGVSSLDIVLSGNSELTSIFNKGCLLPVKDRLLLPEVADPAQWRDGAIKFNDPQSEYLLQTGEYVMVPGIYNGRSARPEDLVSVRSLLDPKFKGKIASFDPRMGGAGQSVAAYFLVTMGEQFVKDLYLGQGVVSTTNHRQLADWIARGTYLIGLSAQERAFGPLLEQGLPIKILTFSDLNPKVTGGSSVLKLVKNAAHPNAAVVLLNWFASKEGQEVFEKDIGQKSRRRDVHLPQTPDYTVPKENVQYYDDYSYQNYAVERVKTTKQLLEILGR